MLREDGSLIPYDVLEEVLFHEYVHVVIKHIAPRGVAWWMNEGLAEALSHNFSALEGQILRRASTNGKLFPLNRLEEHQLEKLSPDQLSVAYAQAHAMVDYLIDDYGLPSVVSVLKRIDSGDSPQDALRKSCHVSYETLDMAMLTLARGD